MKLWERLKTIWEKRPRLHRSSVVVGALVAGVFVLLVVPGEQTGWAGSSWPGQPYYIDYAHGWPWCWYSHSIKYGPEFSEPTAYWGLSWLKRDAWLIWRGKTSLVETTPFNAAALSIDVTIAMVVVTSVSALWEMRRRRRGSIWQFTLRDCVVMTAVIGIGFAYCAHLQSLHTRELNANSRLLKLDFETNLARPDTTWARKPAWLRRLVGGDRIPEWCRHATEVRMSMPTEAEILEAMPYLKALDHLEFIILDIGDHRSAPVSRFKELSSLRELYLNYYEPLDRGTLDQLKALTQLEVLDFDYSPLSESQRRELEEALPTCQIDGGSACEPLEQPRFEWDTPIDTKK